MSAGARVLRERLGAQLLSGPRARDPVAVAGRLLAVQAQDLRGARLAVRARSEGLTAADVDHALTAERSLVVTTLNRGTLHLVRSEDYPLLQALTTPPLRIGNARRLAQEGVDPNAADRGVAAVERALADEGPLTRDRLREVVAAAGVQTEGQALVHVLMLACLRGIAVRGPVVGRQHAFVLTRDWLLPSPPLDRDRALAELARRYLAGHGPADARDLARWAGLPLRDAHAALEAIAPELAERGGMVDLAARDPAPRVWPPPRLLGPWEPLLLGWCDRSPIFGEHAARVVTGGIFRPFVLSAGRAVATWRVLSDGGVAVEPFESMPQPRAAALASEIADVDRFLAPP